MHVKTPDTIGYTLHFHKLNEHIYYTTLSESNTVYTRLYSEDDKKENLIFTSQPNSSSRSICRLEHFPVIMQSIKKIDGGD